MTLNHATDAALDAAIRSAVDAMTPASELLASMARYHMGWVERDFQPVDEGSIARGKRFRPRIALLSCLAMNGDPSRALPLAAAIELLHNFTLVHDDIQDASPLRRHRETVWSIWGIGQAINVGDALFAASHRLLLESIDHGLLVETVLQLATRFDQMTIDIVGGQVTDLRFEDGNPAGVVDYLAMIKRKTAAIVEYAAWSGAIVGGADLGLADQFGAFGEALGLGFQVRDDMLGVWAETAQTGKAAAGDIRRKKQSLPIILLRETVSESERNELQQLFSQAQIPDASVERVLHLLAKHDVQARAATIAQDCHDRAASALDLIEPRAMPEGMTGLRSLVAALAVRQH